MSERGIGPSRRADVLGFLNIGFDDYLASRILLRKALLQQGAALAATAVEKYLKAILKVRGNVVRGHLTARLLRSIANYQPALCADLNLDFIRFLAHSYALRYVDNLQPGFKIVINQFRTLAALDATMAVIDHGFGIQSDGKPIDTAYRAAVGAGSKDLLKDNVVLGDVALTDLVARDNRVYEMRVDDSGSIAVEYVVAGVRMDGGFLDRDACVIGPDPRVMRLTRG